MSDPLPPLPPPCAPINQVARCWDALFNEGPKILFRVALALLQSMEASLLRCDNAGESPASWSDTSSASWASGVAVVVVRLCPGVPVCVCNSRGV
jgi:hypothetical protein